MKPKPLPKDRDTKLLLCSIVNRYSNGGPEANYDSIHYVKPGYLFECAQKAVSSNALTAEGKALVQAWMDQK